MGGVQTRQLATLVALALMTLAQHTTVTQAAPGFPPPESKGGWPELTGHDEIRRIGGMHPDRLDEVREWLLKSDKRDFAAVVIRNGHIVLEVERGNSAKTDSRRVASVSKSNLRDRVSHRFGQKPAREDAQQNVVR